VIDLNLPFWSCCLALKSPPFFTNQSWFLKWIWSWICDWFGTLLATKWLEVKIGWRYWKNENESRPALAADIKSVTRHDIRTPAATCTPRFSSFFFICILRSKKKIFIVHVRVLNYHPPPPFFRSQLQLSMCVWYTTTFISELRMSLSDPVRFDGHH